jgi:predicted small lipoprotein YifL
MHRLKPLLISAIVLLIVSACGQKGPLFLPGTENPQTETASEASDEQKDKEDEGKNEENP